MTQHDERVQYQRDLLNAESWATGFKTLHTHSLKSMWYETEESEKDFENGSVTDVQYNDGIIIRKQQGKVIRSLGKRLKGEELVRAFLRGGI